MYKTNQGCIIKDGRIKRQPLMRMVLEGFKRQEKARKLLSTYLTNFSHSKISRPNFERVRFSMYFIYIFK